jgi:hypothetical protein
MVREHCGMINESAIARDGKIKLRVPSRHSSLFSVDGFIFNSRKESEWYAGKSLKRSFNYARRQMSLDLDGMEIPLSFLSPLRRMWRIGCRGRHKGLRFLGRSRMRMELKSSRDAMEMERSLWECRWEEPKDLLKTFRVVMTTKFLNSITVHEIFKRILIRSPKTSISSPNKQSAVSLALQF